MKISLGRIVILVHDYDDAFQFYATVLNATKIVDYTTPNGQRFLHVSMGSDGAGIWFLKAGNEKEASKVGKQTAPHPAFVVYTDSFDALHQKLKDHAVTITKQPVTTPDYTFLHFLDLYGNEIILVDLHADENP